MVVGENGTHELREPAAPYKGHFGTEKGVLLRILRIRLENAYSWSDFL